MLKLQDIKKDYLAGDSVVHALKGISLEFRDNEFVSILGQSGCGKTTLLNIIGGLDQYTSGDLIINGRSTKDYTDYDWDTYRNHSIGFVFQTYNLIPHQTVLSNVELALTLSGVDKSQRRERAIKALQAVGLGDQINKKPNQMSGGQMQRVAIARALVNDPDIILADEPTGALDSETSVQIMNILKDISKDKLIIMVTHNPELAELYSSRIIKLKDGVILDDSMPYRPDVEESTNGSLQKRPSMGFFTALSLSVNNLMTKKARTILTAFAGSIGIIGIALIMSLSNGIQNYINRIQGDTLSAYPLTIQAESVDMTSMMTSLMGINSKADGNQHAKDKVYSSTILYDLINSMQNADVQTNNLVSFKEYLEDPTSEINQYISAVKYSYDLEMNIYTKDIDDNIVKTDITEILQNAMSQTFGGDYSSYFSTFGSYYSIADAWQELLAGDGDLVNSLTKSQYDVIYGHWPENYDEVVLVVSDDNEVSDLVLYALGLKSNSSLSDDMQSFMNNENLNTTTESWTYEDICNVQFRYIYPSDEYVYNEEDGKYEIPELSDLQLENLYEKGMPIKIVGIIRQNEDAISASMSTGAIGYTHALVEHIVSEAGKKNLVAKQLENPSTDVLTGLPFLEGDETLTDSKKIEATKDYIKNATEEELADIYIEYMTVPEQSYVDETIDKQMEGKTRQDIEDMILDYYPEYESFLADMDDDTLFDYVKQMMEQTIEEQYAVQMRAQYEKLSDKELARDFKLLSLDDDAYLWLYSHALPPIYSDSNYNDVLISLGYVDLDSPSEISLYAATFEDKDAIADCIKEYNNNVYSEEDEIEYTDIVATLMSSISTILNVISYVLIAFVSISLVVSSIMIGIITYISVLERTKEIGILRAIGASKKDVARVFNAETFIIGLFAGLLGVVITVLLNIPITIIVRDLTNIEILTASLPIYGAVFLVFISVLLTYIAGLIPSGMAAKKDPVEALRTE